MGSPDDTPGPAEPGREADEVEHQVTLTNDFEIMTTELTQDGFNTLMSWNPSSFLACGLDCPVETVSWFDALVYANELSADAGYDDCYTLTNVVCVDATPVGANYMACMNDTQGGIESATIALNGVSSVYDCEGYRLPTEAEWEYSARAETTTAYYNGSNNAAEIDDCTASAPYDDNLKLIGWYCADSGDETHLVGEKYPNDWGLYDMSGNVNELTWDWDDTYPGNVTDPEGPGSGTYRITRGGGYISEPKYCRIAFRNHTWSYSRQWDVGFRLARTLP